MAYPVYNNVALLGGSATAQYKNNKGVLIVSDGTGETSAGLYAYADSGGGTRGDLMTIIASDAHAPIILPIRVHSTGTLDNCVVFELL